MTDTKEQEIWDTIKEVIVKKCDENNFSHAQITMDRDYAFCRTRAIVTFNLNGNRIDVDVEEDDREEDVMLCIATKLAQEITMKLMTDVLMKKRAAYLPPKVRPYKVDRRMIMGDWDLT